MGNAEDLAIALPHPCSVSLHQTVKSQWLHLVSKKKMDLEYTFEKAKLDPFSAGFVHSKPVLGVPRFGSGWDACFHRHGGGETMMHSCNIVLHFVSPSIPANRDSEEVWNKSIWKFAGDDPFTSASVHGKPVAGRASQHHLLPTRQSCPGKIFGDLGREQSSTFRQDICGRISLKGIN